jgi:hypothetical protein
LSYDVVVMVERADVRLDHRLGRLYRNSPPSLPLWCRNDRGGVEGLHVPLGAAGKKPASVKGCTVGVEVVGQSTAA